MPGKYVDALALLAILAGIGLFMLWRQTAPQTGAKYFSPADKIRPWAEPDYLRKTLLAAPLSKAPDPPPMASFAITSETRGGEILLKYSYPCAAAPGSPAPFAGEKALQLAPGKFTAAGHTFEIAALATYRRTASPLPHPSTPEGGDDYLNRALSFTALATVAGDPLSTATLTPDDLHWLNKQYFSDNDQTKMAFLLRGITQSDLRWINVTIFDAQTHVMLNNGYGSSSNQSGCSLEIGLNTLVNRPLLVVFDVAVLSTQTTEMSVTTGSTCGNGLLAVRVQQQGECWRNTGVYSGWYGTSEYFELHPTSLPPPKSDPRTTQTTRMLLLETNPAWASHAFACQALDANGKELQGMGSQSSPTFTGRLFEANGTTITKLRLRLPVRYLRIQFELPGIAGLPRLKGNNLFDQRVVGLSISHPWARENLLRGLAQIQLNGPGLSRSAAPSLYTDVPLDQIMRDYEQDMRAQYPKYALEIDQSKIEYAFRYRGDGIIERIFRILGRIF
jgi:hypothetical protein